jgi:hypothetical protein
MIRTTSNQDRAFLSELFSSELLEQAMQFIVDNFEPEELYGLDTMKEWADDNGYIQDPEQ